MQEREKQKELNQGLEDLADDIAKEFGLWVIEDSNRTGTAKMSSTGQGPGSGIPRQPSDTAELEESVKNETAVMETNNQAIADMSSRSYNVIGRNSHKLSPPINHLALCIIYRHHHSVQAMSEMGAKGLLKLLKSTLEPLGVHVTIADAGMVITCLDTSDDDRISEAEFIEWIDKGMRKTMKQRSFFAENGPVHKKLVMFLEEMSRRICLFACACEDLASKQWRSAYEMNDSQIESLVCGCSGEEQAHLLKYLIGSHTETE